MSLLTHIFRRLLLMIPMLIGITLLLFTVTHLIPSNPITVILPEKALNDPKVVKATVEKWGLDKPLYVQYLVYMKNLVQGDMGTSFKTKNPVAKDLMDFLARYDGAGHRLLHFRDPHRPAVRDHLSVENREFYRPDHPGDRPAGRFHAALLVWSDRPVCVLFQIERAARTGKDRLAHDRASGDDRVFPDRFLGR